MIEKGFIYKHNPGEEDAIRITRGEENEVIFEVPDGYIIDSMYADNHADTIFLSLKRKKEEEEDGKV